MKWQISYPSGLVEYFNPHEVQLIMTLCVLKNRKSIAERIFKGEHKSVCAWVSCETLEVKFSDFREDNVNTINYNSKKLPYWNYRGANIDNLPFNEIYSVGNGLFLG